MSSTATATPTDTLQTLTYWCHECDMSVSLLSPPPPPPSISRSSPPPLCPHCRSHLLELMDFSSATTTTTTTATNNSSTPHFHCHPSSIFSLPSSSSDSDYEDDDLHDFVHEAMEMEHTRSFSLIESIPTIKISSLLLHHEDPPPLCPICKDQFLLDVEVKVKQLPCKHIYHSDCIAPWLTHHNTCPVCRFCLPIASHPRQLTPVAVEPHHDDVSVLASSLPAHLR